MYIFTTKISQKLYSHDGDTRILEFGVELLVV